MDASDDHQRRQDMLRRSIRRRGRIALGTAAVAITALSLGGPLMLVLTGDPSPLLPYYPLGWAIAIASWLYWLRCWRSLGKAPPASDTAADDTTG